MTLVNDPQTQKQACTALDALLEILQDVIEQYLQLIMERLAGLLVTAPLSVKAVVTGAIGSAAHASKAKFMPYFQPTMERIQHFLVLTGEGEEQELRGITMDAVGTFAEAIGVDAFRPYFPEMMKQAFQGMEMGSARLRECSFLFFGVMARVFGEEFAQYLPTVIPALLTSCRQSEQGDEGTSCKSQIQRFLICNSLLVEQSQTLKQLRLSHLAPRLLTPLLLPTTLMPTEMPPSSLKTLTLTRCLKSIAPSLLRRRSQPIPSAPFLPLLAIISCPMSNKALWS